MALPKDFLWGFATAAWVMLSAVNVIEVTLANILLATKLKVLLKLTGVELLSGIHFVPSLEKLLTAHLVLWPATPTTVPRKILNS